jgi:hypothetical protein
MTYGYVGDLDRPNVVARLHRLSRSNYRQLLVARHVGRRLRVSGDYTVDSGVDTLRQAVTAQAPEVRVINILHFE